MKKGLRYLLIPLGLFLLGGCEPEIADGEYYMTLDYTAALVNNQGVSLRATLSLVVYNGQGWEPLGGEHTKKTTVIPPGESRFLDAQISKESSKDYDPTLLYSFILGVEKLADRSPVAAWGGWPASTPPLDPAATVSPEGLGYLRPLVNPDIRNRFKITSSLTPGEELPGYSGLDGDLISATYKVVLQGGSSTIELERRYTPDLEWNILPGTH